MQHIYFLKVQGSVSPVGVEPGPKVMKPFSCPTQISINLNRVNIKIIGIKEIFMADHRQWFKGPLMTKLILKQMGTTINFKMLSSSFYTMAMFYHSWPPIPLAQRDKL